MPAARRSNATGPRQYLASCPRDEVGWAPETDVADLAFSETSPGSGVFQENATHMYKSIETFNASGAHAATIYEAMTAVLTAQIGAESECFTERLKTAEAREAFTAFAERRPPDFTKLAAT